MIFQGELIIWNEGATSVSKDNEAALDVGIVALPSSDWKGIDTIYSHIGESLWL